MRKFILSAGIAAFLPLSLTYTYTQTYLNTIFLESYARAKYSAWQPVRIANPYLRIREALIQGTLLAEITADIFPAADLQHLIYHGSREEKIQRFLYDFSIPNVDTQTRFGPKDFVVVVNHIIEFLTPPAIIPQTRRTEEYRAFEDYLESEKKYIEFLGKHETLAKLKDIHLHGLLIAEGAHHIAYLNDYSNFLRQWAFDPFIRLMYGKWAAENREIGVELFKRALYYPHTISLFNKNDELLKQLKEWLTFINYVKGTYDLWHKISNAFIISGGSDSNKRVLMNSEVKSRNRLSFNTRTYALLLTPRYILYAQLEPSGLYKVLTYTSIGDIARVSQNPTDFRLVIALRDNTAAEYKFFDERTCDKWKTALLDLSP